VTAAEAIARAHSSACPQHAKKWPYDAAASFISEVSEEIHNANYEDKTEKC
jgi:hypothetical protein